ncbi:MAG: hypothetical protein WC520_02640 [Candidatus Paceibacterota bacterium]
MIKKIIIAITIFIVIITICATVFVNYRNKTKFGTRSEFKTVVLSRPTDSKMVIFETDEAIIGFGLNEFREELEKNKGGNNATRGYEALISFIENKAKETDEINISGAIKLLDEQGWNRADYQLASLLEEGKCSVFDKSANVYVDKIKMEKYTYLSARSFYGGRNFIFFNSDKIFFEILDMIS